MSMGVLVKNVFLVGFMGVGKTTVARRLARDLRVTAIDVDSYLQRKHGLDVSELFEHHGEDGLRVLEAEALRECAAMGPAVISCGEGVVALEENRVLLANQGLTVLLESSAEESLERIRSLRTRPLLVQGCNADDLWNQRKPYYDEVAHATVDVAQMSTAAAVDRLESILVEQGAYLSSECETSNE